MRKFVTYLHHEATEMENPSVPEELGSLKAKINQVAAQIPAQIDDLVNQLKIRLRTPGEISARRGMGERIRNWWHNLWKGADNPQNPFFMRNRLGAWGTPVSEAAESLAEHRLLSDLTQTLEATLAGQPVYQIDRLLDQWGEEAKKRIMRAIQGIELNVNNTLNLIHKPTTAPVKPPIEKEPEPAPAEVPIAKSDHLTPTHDAIVTHGGGDFKPEPGPAAETKPEPKPESDVPPSASLDLPSEAPKRQKPTTAGEFPGEFPIQTADESKADFAERVKDYLTNYFIYNRSRGNLDRRGRAPLQNMGYMSAEELLYMLTGEKIPFDPFASESTPAPKTEPTSAISGKNLPEIQGVLEKIRQAARTAKAEGQRHQLSPEEQAIELAVWEPWNKLDKHKKAHFNRLGNNGREMRSNNTGRLHLPVVIPWLLTKNDPRTEIIKTYYPKVYDILLSKDHPDFRRIELPTDNEESLRELIAKHWDRSDALVQRRKTKKGVVDPDLIAKINSLKGKIPEDEIDILHKELQQGKIDDVKKTLEMLGIRTTPGHEGEPLKSGDPEFGEGRVYRYIKLLREGGKPIIRSEYSKLPIPKRHEYFKELLSSD